MIGERMIKAIPAITISIRRLKNLYIMGRGDSSLDFNRLKYFFNF
jgi:hypothetical protein